MRLADVERERDEAANGAEPQAAEASRHPTPEPHAVQEAPLPLRAPGEAPRQAEQFKVIRRLRRGRWTLTEVPA